MNTQYKFQYRRFLFWKSITVIGHSYVVDQDKMVLYFPNGSVKEICKWSKCELYLDVDWVNAVRKSQEAKTGQPITLAVG